MTKRLVEIDDELLLAAQHATGTRTITGAVNTALERMVAEHRRRECNVRARWEGLAAAVADLHDPEVMRQAWS